MPTPLTKSRFRKAIKSVSKPQSGWLDESDKVVGKADGTILTGIAGMIYVRDLQNGQVLTVYNSIAPTDRPGLIVRVGRLVGESIYRVKGMRDSYSAPAASGQISPHSHNDLFINRDRFLPFLVLPIDGSGHVVQIYADVIPKPGGSFGLIQNQTLDLLSHVPATGARFALIEADNNGTIYVIDGSVVDAKELLTLANIPSVTSGRRPSCAVRLFDSQTQLYRDLNSINDFIDLRMFTPDLGLTTFTEPYYDAVNKVFAIGDITKSPLYPSPLGQETIHFVGRNENSPALILAAFGASVAPFITGFKADGTEESPTNIKANQPIFRIARARGYDGSAYSDTESEIVFYADGDWSATSHPVRIEFWTTPVGSTTQTLVLTVHSNGTVSYPVKTSDPSSPIDGAMWLLRETTGAHADGEIMGALGMTYHGDTGAVQPLKLSVNDNGTTRRIEFA